MGDNAPDLKGDFDYEQEINDRRGDALYRLAQIGGLVSSQTVDDVAARGAQNAQYNKYTANKYLGGPYFKDGKINLKYAVDMDTRGGQVARAWKQASPTINKVGLFARYYPTIKLMMDDIGYIMSTPEYAEFDRWINGKPIEENIL